MTEGNFPAPDEDEEAVARWQAEQDQLARARVNDERRRAEAWERAEEARLRAARDARSAKAIRAIRAIRDTPMYVGELWNAVSAAPAPSTQNMR